MRERWGVEERGRRLHADHLARLPRREELGRDGAAALIEVADRGRTARLTRVELGRGHVSGLERLAEQKPRELAVAGDEAEHDVLELLLGELDAARLQASLDLELGNDAVHARVLVDEGAAQLRRFILHADPLVAADGHCNVLVPL